LRLAQNSNCYHLVQVKHSLIENVHWSDNCWDCLWCNFNGAMSFNQLDISRTWYFDNLSYNWFALLSTCHFIYCKFVKTLFYLLSISMQISNCLVCSTCYLMSLSFHQLGILSSCLFINILFHQLTVLSTCPFISLAILLICFFGKLMKWLNGKLMIPQLTWWNGELMKWWVDEMANWWFFS
jgi:hypothetical protein